MYHEKFFQFIWKYQLFKAIELKTTDQQVIKVIYQGDFHHHSGPDFQNAKLQIGPTQWVGNVEIHVRSSDFLIHQHEKDENYKNIILHVVYENDKEISILKKMKIPTLEMKSYIPVEAFRKYDFLQNCKDEIACGADIKKVPPVIITNQLEARMIERLENKCEEIRENLEKNNNNWEETFYWMLGKHWGMKVNSDPFEWLVRSTPLTLIKRHQDHLIQLEALLLGQAGLLEKEFEDTYPKKLQNEYAFLKGKYKLSPISKHAWKYLRMRPSNFPTQRLAGLASLFHHQPNYFQIILKEQKLKVAIQCFQTPVSEYWQRHYIPDKLTTRQQSGSGIGLIQNIFINCVIPFLFFYGRERGIVAFEQKAIEWSSELEGEKNHITNQWIKNGVKPQNSIDSQGMIQQFNYYCKQKKCLECTVGTYLIKS
jgi:hypothetical protein